MTQRIHTKERCQATGQDGQRCRSDAIVGSDFCHPHGGRAPVFEAMPTLGPLREIPMFVDGPGLRKLGFTEQTQRVLFRKLPVITIPGHRKPYLRGEDLLAYLAEHTQTRDERRRATPDVS